MGFFKNLKTTIMSFTRLRRFSTIKKGEFFRFSPTGRTFIFSGGGPKKGFTYYPEDDVNDERRTKADKLIYIDFIY